MDFLSKNFSLILVGTLGLVLSAGLLYAAFQIGKPSTTAGIPKAGEKTFADGGKSPSSSPSPSDPGLGRDDESAKDGSSFLTNLKELSKPFLDPFSSESDESDNIFPGSYDEAPGQITRDASGRQEAAPDSTKQWTEQEIFEWTWGVGYRANLLTIQDVMVRDGFMASADKDTVLTTDESIYKVLGRIFEYAIAKGWVTPQEGVKLREGLAKLPEMVELDRAALRAGKVPKVTLPGHQTFNRSPRDQQTLAITLIDGIKYVFSLPEASAQLGIPGWHTFPDCYKDLAPRNPIPGLDLKSFCCNCGLFCTPTGCAYVPDCASQPCNVPLGCLNAPAPLGCGEWPNAIWDAFWYPLGTGTCGCG